MTENGTGTEVAKAATTRASFGAHEITRTAETATTAAAAQAQAHVNAMYIMAERKPRDIMEVRKRLLEDCKRRRFAEEAEYTLPRAGKKITGPSIRFAEAALRALRNIHVKTIVTYEDDDKRVGEVIAIDLEANIPISSGFSFDKTVERKKLKGGEDLVGTRVNSQGQKIHIIRATEADALMKQESIVSRIRRNLILQLLPGDIKDEALEVCKETMRSGDAEDPKATARKLCDAFGTLGVTPRQLADYLGHSVEDVTPDEAAELRGIFASIRDKESTWADVMETRNGGGSEDEKTKSERMKLLQKIATRRVQDADAVKAVLADAGVNVPVDKLPLETLQKVAAMLEAGHGKKASEQTVDSKAETVEDDGDHMNLDKELDDFANRDADEKEARS